MSTQLDWAFDELDRRRAEDAVFTSDPGPGDPRWGAFAQMKFARAQRRKRAGYSRGTANALVVWAQEQEATR